MKKLTKKQWTEILFYSFILIIWVVWAYILPLNEGPDEHMRAQIVEFIIKYGKLPTGFQPEILDSPWGFTYGFRPILPQMLEALFVWIGLIFTKDAFSLLFLARMVSVLSGIVFIGYVRAISHKMFSSQVSQWIFTVLVVCLPQASFMFTYLNCDSMVLMASAMIVYYLLVGMEDRFSTRTCILLAFSLSICILSYYNAYGFLITSLLVFAGAYFQRSRSGDKCWKEFWTKGFLILGIVLLLSGWWFVRNYFLYDGDIFGLQAQNECSEIHAMDFLKPSNRDTYQNQGYSMGYMLFHTRWIVAVIRSFIGMLGSYKYKLFWWMYAGYGVLFLAGGTGILVEAFSRFIRWIRSVERKAPDFTRVSLHLGLLVAILVPNFLNLWYSYASSYQPQGRYSMPMLLPFMYYMARGIAFWACKLGHALAERGQKWLRGIGYGVCVWMAVVLLLCVTHIMWPVYKDVEDKSVVVTYSIEELYGEDWEEKVY